MKELLGIHDVPTMVICDDITDEGTELTRPTYCDPRVKSQVREAWAAVGYPMHVLTGEEIGNIACQFAFSTNRVKQALVELQADMEEILPQVDDYLQRRGPFVLTSEQIFNITSELHITATQAKDAIAIIARQHVRGERMTDEEKRKELKKRWVEMGSLSYHTKTQIATLAKDLNMSAFDVIDALHDFSVDTKARQQGFLQAVVLPRQGLPSAGTVVTVSPPDPTKPTDIRTLVPRDQVVVCYKNDTTLFTGRLVSLVVEIEKVDY